MLSQITKLKILQPVDVFSLLKCMVMFNSEVLVKIWIETMIFNPNPEFVIFLVKGKATGLDQKQKKMK